MRNKHIGNYFKYGGLLLIVAALCLIAYNRYEDRKAADAVADVLMEIYADSDVSQKSDETSTQDTSPAHYEETQTEPEPEIIIPDYVRDPNMEMPAKEINGQTYIGVIDIPALELSLPVISEWSYPRLKIAPCRYQGSAYLDDLIIAAHNYQSHFGTLITLKIGDMVYFTDMNENVFAYKVIEMETLGGSDVDNMVSGDWDLTLFTCTVGGKTRVTVRCEREE